MCSGGDTRALPRVGSPIRKSAGQRLFSTSPRLIAAVHVLHRLLTPRHPPRALRILTIEHTYMPLCSFQGTRPSLGGSTTHLGSRAPSRRRAPAQRRSAGLRRRPSNRPEARPSGRSFKAEQHAARSPCDRERLSRTPAIHTALVDASRVELPGGTRSVDVRVSRARSPDLVRPRELVRCQAARSRLARSPWERVMRSVPRKEVIQPQLPLRLPCYDFTPIADPTFDSCLPCGLAHRLRVLPTFVV